MTTVSHGKPYAGNPHVRLEEGASESAKPSRNALLHNKTISTVVELAEKELECVTGGRRIVGGEGGRFEIEAPKIALRPHPIIII